MLRNDHKTYRSFFTMSTAQLNHISAAYRRFYQEWSFATGERYRIDNVWFALNPAYPDTIEYFNEGNLFTYGTRIYYQLILIAYPLLPALANLYAAIDRLHSTKSLAFPQSIDALDYLRQYTRKWPDRGIPEDRVDEWRSYMIYVAKQVESSPDFPEWDKNTKELENLANKALAESKRVLAEHHRPEKRLPDVIFTGIHARMGTLQRWMDKHLYVVREREDYKAWAAQQLKSSTGSQGTLIVLFTVSR